MTLNLCLMLPIPHRLSPELTVIGSCFATAFPGDGALAVAAGGTNKCRGSEGSDRKLVDSLMEYRT